MIIHNLYLNLHLQIFPLLACSFIFRRRQDNLFFNQLLVSPWQESTVNVDVDFKKPFLELNSILEALHKQDLGPALR